MVYISDLQCLVNRWQERVDSSVHSSSYKDGIMDCIYELNQVINKSIEEELDYRDSLEQAEEYFSNLEPEDYYAAV